MSARKGYRKLKVYLEFSGLCSENKQKEVAEILSHISLHK